MTSIFRMTLTCTVSRMVLLKVVWLLAFVCFSKSTIDINIHQLQMVADHLSKEECRKLAEALHQTSIFLEADITGENEPDRSCIFLLLRWERTEGNGKTFADLALRLGQIGRRDLANRLSKAIYNEESDELKRTFLDQPFKKKIPKNSFLLAQDDIEVKDLKPAEGETSTGLAPWELVSIILGALCVTLIIVFLIYYLFGSMIARIFRSYAPEFIVTWVDMVSSECKWFWRKTKQNYSTHLLGSRAGRGAMASQKRRWTVEEMNRNLNNYLNGHINEKDRFRYFP